MHPLACFRSDPRSLPSKADEFGSCSLLALKAPALRRSKGSRNYLISFPLTSFFPLLFIFKGRKREFRRTRTCCRAGRVSGWEGSPEPRGTRIHTSTPCQPCSFPKNGGLVPAHIPLPFLRGGRKPSRASLRNRPKCPGFISASESEEKSLQPGRARGTESPSFA